MIRTWGRSQHPSIEGWIFWASLISIKRFAIKRGNDGKYAHIQVWGSQKAYACFNLNFTDQRSLFCRLSDMCCASALAIEEGNAFESQTGVTVVQTSKVKLGGHCVRHFRHVLVSLKTWVFWIVLQTKTKTTGGCGIISECGYCWYFALLSWSPLCCAC